MDVRCEKCQTEYELDEARLKPGGVTVKCTNCGHMFKIRKRTITNVGVSSSGSPPSGPSGWAGAGPGGPGGPGGRDAGGRPPPTPRPLPSVLSRPRGESLLEDEMRPLGPDEAPTTIDRQWLIRLDNGEQKSCRELATLQQWIIAGVVTRESLISRTGKTWKRIGDIADLGQYFAIADEARANRDRARPPSRPGGPIASVSQIPGTIPGYGAAQAAGGTILPDDDDGPEGRTTRAPGRQLAHTPPPLPTRGVQRSGPPGPSALGPTEPASLHAPPTVPAAPPRRAGPTPPPPPPRRVGAASGPAPGSVPPPPQGNRATAMWATDGVKPEAVELPTAGPFVGKLAAIPDEPAFAGRVRMAPGDAASFDPGRVRAIDDDDEVLPPRRGSRAGMWVLLMALVVMGGAAAGVYLLVLRDGRDESAAHAVKDAGVVVAAVPDAAQIVAPGASDAAAVEAVAPIAAARAGLGADLEPWLRTTMQGLDARTDAPSQALRAHVMAQLAQDLIDRAGLIANPEADNLRKDAKQLVLDAANPAQRALRAAGDDPGANIAMAEVLRLQGKPARDIARYLETARAKPDKNWAVELALADAMVLARDGKLDEARAAFAVIASPGSAGARSTPGGSAELIDGGDGKLETAGDVRARFHLALVLAAQGKAADAKPLVAAILAAQPEHAGARALSGKLETMVAKTDPLPPEDGTKDGTKDAVKDTPPRPNPRTSGGSTPPSPPPSSGGPETYDRLVARANAIADSSCARAMDLYSKALEQKPNGVEALAGLGYCQIDAKQFSSAFSKFRAALAVSPRYEPALRGIAETYQQMGRKEQAIEAYKAYLEVYPDSVAARKQLERLGGDTGAHPPAGSAAPPSTPPATPPSAPASPPAAPANPPANPPVQPAPSGDSAGAGSGSG